MLTEVEVAGEPTWKESSTYLRRERRPSSSSPTPSQSEGKAGATPPTSIWPVPKDIGRRYAAVSGDVNPIHLNPVVARLFGFRRAIAHGMWLKARCVAALEGRVPDALVVDVEFKSPLLLPSTVAYHAERNGHGWSMSVAQVRTDRPHLRGAVHEL
jgi:acyl dehydratase